ncbi:hypothetical protein [Ancylobacter sp. SL191]|uniref:hypothetical protein n=1 Tax=Ancylobacter sp. SL191 TaxID=2995166 RepID=UPI002271EB1F|nr:hypothetical protein OU996_19545 [Ancylobacter sp. SL191]
MALGYHASHEQFAPANGAPASSRRARGFRDIYLHNVGVNQRAFIDDFGAKVLPHFPSAA